MVALMHTPPAPIGDGGPRRTPSAGGPNVERGPWATAPGIVDFRVRTPLATNDQAVSYERFSWLHQSYYAGDPGPSAPQSTGLVNYLGSGQARRSLHMRAVTIIEHVQGASNTRAQDPYPTGYGTNDGVSGGPVHGLHTRSRVDGTAVLGRSQVTQQQRPPRQNRLSNSRNRGQSYSQITVHQGG